MKQLIIIAISLLIFIVIGISSNNYLLSSAKEISSDIDNMEVYSKQNDWYNTTNELVSLKDIWNKNKKIWAILIDHFEIDDIDSSIAKTSKYIETKNISDTLGESSNLKLLIEHIPETHLLNLKNIL